MPSRRTVALALVAWSFAATLARALRVPNDFALAHWLLDYRLGFAKRGLAGSLAALAGGGRPTEPLLVAISFALAAVSAAALLYALWQLVLRGRDEGSALLALVLAGSPLVVMHAHLVGYLDGIVVTLGVAAVALALRGRVAAGSIAVAIAVLAHEGAVLVVLPSFLLAVRRRGGDRRGLLAAAAPPLAAFAALALAQALQPAPALREAIAARLAQYPWLDPVIRESLPRWLTEPFLENLRQCADGLWERSLRAVAPALVAPTLAAALWTARRRLRGLPDRRATLALFIAACLLPQLAQLFAWDAPRLWTWSLLSALLASWVLAATGPAPADASPFPRAATAAFGIVLVANAWFTIPLMDSRQDNLAPALRLLLILPPLAGAARLVLPGRARAVAGGDKQD